MMIIKSSQICRNLVITSSYYRELRCSVITYGRHKLIYKVMIVNKNSNQSQLLKTHGLHHE